MNPSLRRFGESLIAHEAAGRKLSNAKVAAVGCPAAFSDVYEKLREPLFTLVGAEGLRALISRALTQGKEEAPWLGTLQVNADGALKRPEETATLDRKQIREGELVFISKLIGLLVTFIGATVTLHLVQNMWPGVKVKDMEP